MTNVDHDVLIATLDRLKLTAIRDQLDTLLDEAARSKMTLREALAFLVSREIARRDERRISMSSKLAQFPFVREFGRLRLRGAAIAGSGTDQGACDLPLDRPRRHRAIPWTARYRQDPSGCEPRPRSNPSKLQRPVRHGGHAGGDAGEGTQRRLARQAVDDPVATEIAVIDELGYLPFEANAAHLFFQLVSRRYEKGSILITSNRSVGEWGSVFGDPVVATAILDRLLHHSTVITIRGDSYRLREKRRSGLLQKAGAALQPNETANQ